MATLGLIFSNIHDQENFEVTKQRTIASTPIGGRYRLIDFSLSSMVNNNISHIGVVTKNNYQSLMDHVGSGKDWDLARKRGGLTILPPYGTTCDFYNSRLEALKSIIRFIDLSSEEYVVLTDCYHVCNIDYRPVFRKHFDSCADITCMYRNHLVKPDDYKPVTTFTLNDEDRIVDMKSHQEFQGMANTSIDTWIMKKDLLSRLVHNAIERGYKSFNRDILKENLQTLKIVGYRFDGYFGSLSSMKTYYEVNMDLINPEIRNELFNKQGHSVYTKVRDSAPTKYGMHAKVINSVIADGCFIDGIVENCVLFRGTVIHQGVHVKNSILMQSTEVDCNTQLSYVITDKNVTICNTKNLHGTPEAPIYIKKRDKI